MKKTFDRIPDTDFSLKGFRFKEEQDFSSIEFTQFHDVYYNTGIEELLKFLNLNHIFPIRNCGRELWSWMQKLSWLYGWTSSGN